MVWEAVGCSVLKKPNSVNKLLVGGLEPSYGKSLFSMGESTISTGPCSIVM